MHHDDTIATQVGNPSVFGHGMLSMGLAARVVKDWFGPEAIRRFQVRFAKQVWPGDVLTCTAVVTGKRDEGGEHLVDLDLTVANQDGDKAITGAATAAVGADRWDCSTVASRSSPVRVAASAASSRCASRARARKVVVNDVGVSLDGRGTDEDPAAQVCKEIEALGVEGGAELRLGHRLRRRRAASCRPRSTRSARSTSS